MGATLRIHDKGPLLGRLCSQTDEVRSWHLEELKRERVLSDWHRSCNL